MSGQDKPNPVLLLAIQAGKMELSCPLGTSSHCVLQEKYPRMPYNESFIDQACLIRMSGYWPCSFFARVWTSILPQSINTQKKELGQYPVILTSHLVNNPRHIRHYMALGHAFKTKTTQLMTISIETVHMAKFWPKKYKSGPSCTKAG